MFVSSGVYCFSCMTIRIIAFQWRRHINSFRYIFFKFVNKYPTLRVVYQWNWPGRNLNVIFDHPLVSQSLARVHHFGSNSSAFDCKQTRDLNTLFKIVDFIHCISPSKIHTKFSFLSCFFLIKNELIVKE